MGFAEKLMIHGECSRFEEKEKPPDSVLLLLPGGGLRVYLTSPETHDGVGGTSPVGVAPHRHVDMTIGVLLTTLRVLRQIARRRKGCCKNNVFKKTREFCVQT